MLYIFEKGDKSER